ncbi:uncharacterized protein LOC122278541 [Carya illinoinensis]|uniref:uncharacterized protein LOC122278541 n=1 Tax=Carya illinoinensis TaxID=32201 RepID=UPI001C725174|nr:uncharacterized protein LOC122278541 [Carya illinoinensis]
MEGLEDMWGHLSLTEEEEVIIEVENDSEIEIQWKGERSLIGKVCSERYVGKKVIGNTMARIWRISKRAVFQEVERNTFVVTFATHADKERVLEGKPWLFDNVLFILVPYDGVMQPGRIAFDYETFWIQIHNLPLGCMSMEWGKRIGDSVGRCMEVDVESDGVGWGKCLRVKVAMPLCKAIARGRFINVQGEKIWINFCYEKLPKICFTCGWITHGEDGCATKKDDNGSEGPKGMQFG